MSRKSPAQDPSQDLPVMDLAVERLSRRIALRWTSPIGPERFRGLPSIEDRPLYLAARAVLRRAGRLRVRTWVQTMAERPPGIDSQLEQRVPQFFLRNIARAEREVAEELPFEVTVVRDPEGERQLASLRKLRYQPPELLKRWNLDEVLWLRSMLRHYLFDEDWRRRFGRELKEGIRGPLYKYDPDKVAPSRGPCSSS